MVTVYWSYPWLVDGLPLASILGMMSEPPGGLTGASSEVMRISVVLKLVKGFWMTSMGVLDEGLLKARSCLRLEKMSLPAMA